MARPNSGAILKDLRENLGKKFYKKTVKEEAIIQEAQTIDPARKTQAEKITRTISTLLGSDEDVATIIISADNSIAEAVQEIESQKFANKRFFVFAHYSQGRFISSVVDFDNALISFSERLSDQEARAEYNLLLETLERKRIRSDLEVLQQITDLEHIKPAKKVKPEFQASNRERDAKYLAQIKTELQKKELIGKFQLQQIPATTLIRPNHYGDLNDVIALLNACFEVYRLKAQGQEKVIQNLYVEKAKNIARYFFGSEKIDGENFSELAKITEQKYEELMASEKRDEIIMDADEKLRILMAINNLYKEKKKILFNDAELEKTIEIQSKEELASDQAQASLEFYSSNKPVTPTSTQDDFYFKEIGFTNYGDLILYLKSELSKTRLSAEENQKNHHLVNFLFPIFTSNSLPTLDNIYENVRDELISSDKGLIFRKRFIEACNIILECHGFETKEPDEYGVRIDYISGKRTQKAKWIKNYDPDLDMLIRMLQSCIKLDIPESNEIARNLYNFLQEEVDGKYGAIKISDEVRRMIDSESDIGEALSHLDCEPIMTPEEFQEEQDMREQTDTESEEEHNSEDERKLYSAQAASATASASSATARAFASAKASATASASAWDFAPMAPPPDPRQFLLNAKRQKIMQPSQPMLAIMPAPSLDQSDTLLRPNPENNPAVKSGESTKLSQDFEKGAKESYK